MHSVLIHTDAAGRSELSYGGWGGWTKENGKLVLAAGQWDFETRPSSSAFLELLAMKNVIQSLNQDGRLDKQRVLVRTDSQPARDILVKGGSVVSVIHEVCMPLLWYCIERGIDLVIEWIPRERNQFADALSKRRDSCDWMLNPDLFAELAAKWGHDGGFAVDH